jgi:glycerophosphoryl diester phosphodiesterase
MRLPRVTAALSVAALAATALVAPAAVAAPPAADVELGTPRDQAHAHNDYEHQRPLLDALEHGFTSVEADVWLVDGELLVAHDAWELEDAKTFEELYLEPLADIVRGKGRSVYPGWDGTFQLLVDIKSEGEATYAAVESALAEHRQLFTRYVDGQVKPGPVQVVISGNRPFGTISSAHERLAFYDGRSRDLGSGIPASVMPLVSDNWNTLFTWRGVGEMPAAERERQHRMVEAAHSAGYRIRFWATPDAPGAAREALWTELVAAGVDHVNTDDLAGLEAFLAARG